MEPMNNKPEIEIDLKELFFILFKKLWIIIAAGIFLAIIVFFISKFAISPQYESTTKVYILNKQDENSAITSSDLQTGSQLTQDYMTLVKSRPVTQQVINELNLDMSTEALSGLISVSNPANTRILFITVKYEDPNLAKEITDAIREASATHIASVMGIEKVNLVEEGNTPEGPSSPNISLNTAIGFILGILISCFIIILIHMLDDTIKTPDDVEKYLGLSVLSSIPLQDKTRNVKKKKTFFRKRKLWKQ